MTDSRVDLMVTGGLVLTRDDSGHSYADGVVIIDQGRIKAVGPASLAADYQADQTIDSAGGLILPGLINSHTHAAMTLFRGLADDLPLMDWLEGHIFPAEAKLTPELIEIGTRLAAAEMIMSGTTCLVDMYLWEDTVAQELDRAGLRALVGEVLYDFPSPHYGDLDSGFAFTEDFIAHYRDHDRISVAVMPHALYTCAPDLLKRAWELADRTGVGVHTHLAESLGEEQMVQEAHGKRPVDHLAALDLLTPNLLAAHGVHLSDADLELLAQGGVSVAHCPESNLKLASGVARLTDLLTAGVPVGLGTDGAASNNDLSLIGEMRSCALIHKATDLDPTAAPAEAVLSLTTDRAAEAIGLGSEIGSLVAGKRADLIIVGTDRPHLTPLYNPVSHLVYAALPSDVTHTVVGGRVLMADRQLTTIDLDRLRADVTRAAKIIRP